MLLPGPWSYEMMECWQANTIWTQSVPGVQSSEAYSNDKAPMIMQDHEMETGRTKYASNITGAYYAARREIVEMLYLNHKCARAIVFREVGGGYLTPLGVWVIRETIRNTLRDGFNAESIKTHETLHDALSRIKQDMRIPLRFWLNTSKFLKILKTRRTLDEWMK
jgi:DNA repair protein NreA